MQRPHIAFSRTRWMPMITWFVPMESRNCFHHEELFLAFREGHSRSLVWCLFGDSYAGINLGFSRLQFIGSNNFVNESIITAIYFKVKL